MQDLVQSDGSKQVKKSPRYKGENMKMKGVIMQVSLKICTLHLTFMHSSFIFEHSRAPGFAFGAFMHMIIFCPHSEPQYLCLSTCLSYPAIIPISSGSISPTTRMGALGSMSTTRAPPCIPSVSTGTRPDAQLLTSRQPKAIAGSRPTATGTHALSNTMLDVS